MINEKLLVPIVSSIFHSFTGVIMKTIYKNFTGIKSEVLFFFIALFSSITMFTFISIKNRSVEMFKIGWKKFLISAVSTGFIYFLIDLLIFHSLFHIGVALQKMISSSKLFVVIIINSLVFKKNISKKNFLIASLIFVGLLLMIGKINFAGNKNLFRGIFLATISMLINVFYHYLFKNISNGIDSVIFSFYVTFISSISSLIAIYFEGQMPILYSVLKNYKLLSILFLASFTIYTLSSPLYFWSLENVGIFSTIACGRIGPALSVIWGYLILGEKLTKWQILGCHLIMFASILNIFDKKKDSTHKKEKN